MFSAIEPNLAQGEDVEGQTPFPASVAHGNHLLDLRTLAADLPPLCACRKDLLNDSLGPICPRFGGCIRAAIDRVTLAPQLHMIDLWLSGSRRCPLLIEIQNRDEDERLVHKVLFAFEADRVRLEFLHVSSWAPQIPSVPMPLLRYLHLWFDDEDAGAVALCQVPLLRSVVLQDSTPSNINLPWAQLTSLALNPVAAEHLPILHEAFNLVRCVLHIFYDSDANDLPDPQEITFAYLESSTLDDNTGDALSCMYPDVFIVPALRSLLIKEPAFLNLDLIGGLASFISRPGCEPQEVCITGIRSTTNQAYRKAFLSIQFFTRSHPNNGLNQ
ncbi:hypothetical protein DFH09DRAFT_1328529 [Mycena vulgaris]|nr:hypothetical protein DFH09DRAFT_1328529 [Mycena vulgaris]